MTYRFQGPSRVTRAAATTPAPAPLPPDVVGLRRRSLGLSALVLLTLGVVSCSDGGGGSPDAPTCQSWTPIGPEGGFVSSIAFDTSTPGYIWASGDDSSGIYRSTTNGSVWRRQVSVPRDHGTYALLVDPTDGTRVYAPNYFGRGLLATSDGAVTWTVRGAGLPMFGAGSKLSDLALDPSSTAVLFACTSSGLYQSVDFGDNFAQVTSPAFGADTDFRSVVSSADGVFVGSATGRVYRTIDVGANWTEVTTGAFVPVTDLAVTEHALYVAFTEGTLVKTTTFTSAGLSVLNTGGGGGTIDTGLWTKVAAVSGVSAASDTLYVGTVAKVGSALWGFHASVDGGATFERRINGLQGASIFSMAVDPLDASSIVVGTVGQGIFRTADAGELWTEANDNVRATAALAVATDESDADHLLVSSTEGLDGTPGVFETTDGGDSWSVVSSLVSDALSLDIHPSNPSILLAGQFNESSGPRPGIMRSVSGSAGPWVAVLSTSVQIERFVRTGSAHFAVATQSFAPAGPADVGAYASIDDGATWDLRFNEFVSNLASHPTADDELIVVGADAWASTDSLATSPTSLGLSTIAPGEIFTSVAFVTPSNVLVGSNVGKLYESDNYDPSGAGVTWTEVVTPAQDVFMRDIVVIDSHWYIACFTGDFVVQPTSTPGVLHSDDAGQSWEFLECGLGSSRLVWSLQRESSSGRGLIASMWGGGALAFPGH